VPAFEPSVAHKVCLQASGSLLEFSERKSTVSLGGLLSASTELRGHRCPQSLLLVITRSALPKVSLTARALPKVSLTACALPSLVCRRGRYPRGCKLCKYSLLPRVLLTPSHGELRFTPTQGHSAITCLPYVRFPRAKFWQFRFELQVARSKLS